MTRVLSNNFLLKNIRSATLATGLIVIGGLAVWGLSIHADRSMREDLIEQSRSVSHSINIEHIKALKGSGADLESADYIKLKNQLASIKSSNSDCRFVYLMGTRPVQQSTSKTVEAEKEVFFFADSEPKGSEDESPPGQIYEEASEEAVRVFETGIPYVEGPVPDRWGTWVSALMPINDPESGQLIAVLGMDIDAHTWRQYIAMQVALPMFLVLILLIVALSSLNFKQQSTGEEKGNGTIQPMGLQQKTAFTLGVSLIILIAILYLVSRSIIHNEFNRIEKRDAFKNVERLLLTLKENQSTLESIVQDWAYWDETYDFVQKRNIEYIKGNLNPESLETLRIQALAIFSTDGSLVWGGALKQEDSSPAKLEEDFEHSYKDIFRKTFIQDTCCVYSGIILDEGKPMLAASAPILTSQQQGPAQGNIVMGQILDDSAIEQLSSTLRLDISLVPVKQLQCEIEMIDVVRELSAGATHVVRNIDNRTLEAYSLIRDISGEPVLLARINMPREIYRKAVRTTFLIAVLLALFGLLVILSVLLLMRKLVLSKLERLSGNINRIAGAEDFSDSIKWEGSDELAGVARDVNLLLEAVRQSRRKQKAGEEQLAATLHSIGDAVIACDHEGKVTSINRMAETLTGWMESEASGKQLEEILHIVDILSRETVSTPVTKILSGIAEENQSIQVKLISRDGTEYLINYNCAPIHDSFRNVIGAVLVFRDVTEEYMRQEKLRESEIFQRELLLNLPAGVVIVDPETRLIDLANEHAAALFGASPDAMIGRHCHKFLCPSETGACPICDRGSSIDHSERMMLRSDGTTFPILKTARLVRIGGKEKLLECFVDISKRKQAEEALRDFRMAVEQSADGICLTDLDGTIRFANTAWRTMHGFDQEDFKGCSISMFHSTEQWEKQIKPTIEQIQIKGSFHGEIGHMRKDGSEFPSSMTSTVIRNAEGQPEGLLGIARDITESKENEERSRALAQCLLDFSTDRQSNISKLLALCGKQLGCSFAQYNRLKNDSLIVAGQWPETAGSKEKNPVQIKPDGCICYDVISQAKDMPLVMHDLQNSPYAESTPCIENCKAETVMGMAVKCHGRAVGALCMIYRKNVQPKAEHLSFLRLAGYAMSVEEERDRQLKMQELLTQIAATYINLPLNRVDKSVQESLGELGRFVEADRVYIFDYNFSQDYCRNTYEWCSKGTPPQIQELQELPLSIIPKWVEVHQRGEPMNIPDVLNLAPDDDIRRVLEPQDIRSLVAIPIMNADRCLGFVGFDFVHKTHVCGEVEIQLLTIFAEMMASIQLRRELEEILQLHRENAEAATRAKSEFLANMSHEIRTPMNGVTGMLELLLGTELNAEQHRFARIAVNSAESLLTLINDILDFSKMEAGKLTLDKDDFSLRRLLDESMAPLAFRAQSKKVEFICAAAPNVPDHLQGDPIRIRQILVNLAGNAIKFTEKGEIAVRVELESETVCKKPDSADDAEVTCCTIRFSVSDTGIGMPESKQALLFEKFSQLDTSSTRRYAGTGLGLAIAKQLTELMGGEIGVESKEGQGTTFWVKLKMDLSKNPIVDPVETEESSNSTSADIHGANILVVDDNETNREVLTTQLKAWNFRVQEAEDGPSALSLLRKAREEGIFFRAAILDMQMPGMDGVALAQVIRHDPAYTSMRLLLLTSMGNKEGDTRFKQAVFSACLPKPVSASALFNALQKALLTQSGQVSVEPAVSVTSDVTTEEIKAHILLVEDNGVNRLVAEKMLKKMGISCDVAGNGVEAIAAFEREQYDLILMDVQMPVMDGFDATRQIRKMETEGNTRQKSGHIPVIAMTAHAMQKDREKCLEAGMDDFITKPVLSATLQSAIKKWLK